MIDELEIIAPSLPLGLSVPISLLLLLFAGYLCARLRYLPATFVILAAWIRYTMQIFHQFTFSASPVGPSWNALASIGAAAIGLLIVLKTAPRMLALKTLLPIYLLVGISLLSAVVNMSFANLQATIPKWIYLIVMVICMERSLTRLGDRFMSYLLVAFSAPFVFQLVSVLIGQTKAGETDGSVSYVGGYNHEGAISIVLITGVVVACLARRMPPALRLLAIFGGFAGVLLADYRTTIVSFLPLLLAYVLSGPMTALRPPQRALVLVSGLLIAMAGVAVSGSEIAERYGDIAKVANLPDYLGRQPDEFNREDQKIMSGRPYLWARYLTAWREGPPHYRLIGAGPEARIPTKDKYPHNTLISAVFEYGYVGLIGYLLLFGSGFVVAMGAAPGDRMRLLAAHGSFFILNMATMPMWQIEGTILYALLWGYTLYAANVGRTRRLTYVRVAEDRVAQADRVANEPLPVG